MLDLKAKLAEVERSIKQTESNYQCLQGAKQMLLQLIKEEENAKGGEDECSKSAITEQ